MSDARARQAHAPQPGLARFCVLLTVLPHPPPSAQAQLVGSALVTCSSRLRHAYFPQACASDQTMTQQRLRAPTSPRATALRLVRLVGAPPLPRPVLVSCASAAWLRAVLVAERLLLLGHPSRGSAAMATGSR